MRTSMDVQGASSRRSSTSAGARSPTPPPRPGRPRDLAGRPASRDLLAVRVYRGRPGARPAGVRRGVRSRVRRDARREHVIAGVAESLRASAPAGQRPSELPPKPPSARSGDRPPAHRRRPRARAPADRADALVPGAGAGDRRRAGGAGDRGRARADVRIGGRGGRMRASARRRERHDRINRRRGV